MTLKRWLPRLAALLVVGGVGAYLWIARPWQGAPTPISFETVQVGRGTIAAQVTANGTLSARGTVEVGAQVSGRVVELHADFNDHVTKGQVIAKLDAQVLRVQIDQVAASVAVAQANIKKAEVAVADAKRQYARQQTLAAQQLIAGATVEAAEVSYETARAALAATKAQPAQASASLSQARLNLSYATIVSPVDGVVLSRAVDVGQTVAASLQAPVLFTIAEDLARMQIDTAVGEADVGQLAAGMKTNFTVDAFPGKSFDGVVRQVRNAPTTTSGVVTYDAVIDVDNADKRLRPGMTANVTFVLAEVVDAIKIPNSALRFSPTRDQLLALRPSSNDRAGRGSGRGSGGSGQRRRGDGGGGGGAGSGGAPPSSNGNGGGGGGDGDGGGRKPVWKLVAGVPQRVMVKPGLTDGSTTEMLAGDLQPGDELVTEINGVERTPQQRRRTTGGF